MPDSLRPSKSVPGASDFYPEHSLTISDSEDFRNSKNDAQRRRRVRRKIRKRKRTLSLKFSWWQQALH